MHVPPPTPHQLKWRQTQIDDVMHSNNAIWLSRHAPEQMIPPPDIHTKGGLSRFLISMRAWKELLGRVARQEKKKYSKLGIIAF